MSLATRTAPDTNSRWSTTTDWINKWMLSAGELVWSSHNTIWLTSHLLSSLTQSFLISVHCFQLSNYYLQNDLTPTFLYVQMCRTHYRNHTIPSCDASSAPRVKPMIINTPVLVKSFSGDLKCQMSKWNQYSFIQRPHVPWENDLMLDGLHSNWAH